MPQSCSWCLVTKGLKGQRKGPHRDIVGQFNSLPSFRLLVAEDNEDLNYRYGSCTHEESSKHLVSSLQQNTGVCVLQPLGRHVERGVRVVSCAPELFHIQRFQEPLVQQPSVAISGFQ